MNYKIIREQVLFSRRSLFLFGLSVVLAVAIGCFMPSGKVFAAGGVGTGGSGSGGSSSAGYNTRNGHGWLLYDVNGAGPSGGFRNGTAWSNVQAVCRGANAGSVMLFGISNSAGNIKGYNFIQDYSSGHYAAGTVLDGGRATAIPTSWAQAAFDQLPSQGVSTAGFTFGGANGNVAWFCTGISNVNHDPAGDSVMSCNTGFQGWALDADDLNARLGFAIIIKPTGTAWDPSNYKINGTANQAIPNPPFDTTALAAFGVNQNRGFTIALPDQFKNGTNYDWMILAANAAGTPSNPLGFSILGQGAFNCPSPVTSFTITLKGQTTLLPDNENPNQAQFTNVGATTNRAVNGVVMSRQYVIRKPGQSDQNLPSPPAVTVNIPTGTTGINLSPNPDFRGATGLSAGDQVCVIVTASPGSGKANSSNDITEKGADKSADFCARVVNKPYLSVYSGDVYAGGNFASTSSACPFAGNIAGYLNTGGYGSGTQLAATALGTISGFNSASMRTSGVAARPKGLSFANTPSLGQFSGNHCLRDYFADSAAATSVGSLDLNTAASGDYKISGDVTLGGATIQKGRQLRLFVEGTVKLTGNIQFSTVPRGARADVPSLQIIARNITISNGVQTVDGIYVAQPKLGQQATQGSINTCTEGAGIDSLYGACSNQLVINGAFIANRVQFRRTLGSLRNAVLDQPFGLRAGCSGSNPGGSKPTCAAEVFNFTPELYLTVPSDGSTNLGGPDDYNVVLPPVL